MVRVARRALVCAAVLAPLLAAADVIFRVPEVLVRHAAASKPVGTGRANASRPGAGSERAPGAGPERLPNGSERWPDGGNLLEVRYEEYFVEHDVSAADAKKAAKELNLDNVPVSRDGCGACSRAELEYCESRVLADHCCCEWRFLPEPFPWLPHTCYAGPRRCRPLAHDCVRYARLRDCCCYRKMAERWKSILSASSRARGASLLLLSMLLAVSCL